MFRHRLISCRSAEPGTRVTPVGGARRHALAVIGGCACCLTLVNAALAEDGTPSGDASASTPATPDDLTPAVLLDDLETTAREKQARLERLRQQLLKLAEQARRVSQPRENVTAPEPPTGDPHAVPPPPDDQDPHPPSPPVSDPGLDDPSAPSEGGALHSQPAVPGHATDPVPHQEDEATEVDGHSASSGEDVAGTRINRLALGDSLFASGQAELALQAYSSIELTRLAATDRYWIEYQIANCHRRLGATVEAEKRYRRLAGQVDGGWCAAHSRWWLDAISTRTALQRDLATIQRTLKTIEEQLNDPSTP